MNAPTHARARVSIANRWARPVAVVSAALALTVLVGCGRPAAKGSAAERQTGNSGTGENITTGLTRWAPADRLRLPLLGGRTLDGDRLDVSDWRGRVVVINAWGSWCGPCRKEAPDLRRVSEETMAAGVRFVGIDTRDNDAAGRAFGREFGITYPSLIDDSGRVMLAFGQTIPASAVPSTVVVDRRGRIAARVIGAVTYITLRGLVDEALAEVTTRVTKSPTGKRHS